MRHLSRLDRFLYFDAGLPLESVILLIGGMALAITGGLFIFVSAGVLPYYEDGFFGLLLMVFALQTIALGKTPFGDMRRSKPLLLFGVAVASIGIITCFIPGLFDPLPRILLSLCFGLGGGLQLLQSSLDETKMRTWMQYGGVFRHLLLTCVGVYVLSILAGLLLWTQHPLPTPITATVMLLLGFLVIYLGGILRRVYLAHPTAQRSSDERFGFSFEHCMLLLTSVFMILLGTLLIPVNLGLLPFSENAQLGLLVIIFSIQMLASGDTPIGPFPHRSLLSVSCGVLFAALGTISCVIPNVLVSPLTLMVALLNILGGLIPLGKRLLQPAQPTKQSAAPPLLQELSRTQLIMNLLSITFGTSMLVPNLIPGLVVGAILAANGGVLLYLLRLLVAIAALGNEASRTPELLAKA